MSGCANCPYYSCGLGGEYCDKVGGKIAWYGYCSDCEQDVLFQKKKSCGKGRKEKARARRAAEMRHKNKLKFQATYCKWYPSPAYEKVENGVVYYVKTCKSSHSPRYSYFKRYSNKQVRKYNENVRLKRSVYKKVFDYWWNVD